MSNETHTNRAHCELKCHYPFISFGIWKQEELPLEPSMVGSRCGQNYVQGINMSTHALDKRYFLLTICNRQWA